MKSIFKTCLGLMAIVTLSVSAFAATDTAKVTLIVAPENSGCTIKSDSGMDFEVDSGATFTLEAIDSNGFAFTNWTATGITVPSQDSTNEKCTFTVDTTAAVTITANFEKSTSIGINAKFNESERSGIEISAIGSFPEKVKSVNVFRVKTGTEKKDKKVGTLKLKNGNIAPIYDIVPELGTEYTYYATYKKEQSATVKASMPAATDTDVEFSTGTYVDIAADSVFAKDTSWKFDRAPAVSATYIPKYTTSAKAKKVSFKVTKKFAKGATDTQVVVFTKTLVPTYDAKAFKNKSRAIPAHKFVLDSKYISDDMQLDFYAKNVNKENKLSKNYHTTIVGTFLNPTIDTIHAVDSADSVFYIDSDIESNLTINVTEEKDFQICVDGFDFGVATPKVFIDYKDAKSGKFKQANLKAAPADKKATVDAVTKSKITKANGESTVIVTIPGKSWKKKGMQFSEASFVISAGNKTMVAIPVTINVK